MQNRFEVHSHTDYSNLRLVDSINTVEKLIDYAIEIGLKGLAITDHECISGHVRAEKHMAEIQEQHPDFKLAFGNEIYLVDERSTKSQRYYHFILIAKDAIGHKQIRKLSTRAWLLSYNTGMMERVPTLKSDLVEIIGEDKGHLIATTACLGGELSSNVLAYVKAREVDDMAAASVAYQNIDNFLKFCIDMFGDDFYIECAPGASEEQVIVNKKLVEIADVYHIPMVIGTDAHYLKAKDRYVHKSYLNSKNGEREVDLFYEYAYLQTEDEILTNLKPSIASKYAEMCANSMNIYDKIERFSLLSHQDIPRVEVEDYPKNDWWNNSLNDKVLLDKTPLVEELFLSENKYERYWINQCFKGMQDKGIDWRTNFEYVERLAEEANVKRVISEKLNTNMFLYPITLQHYIDMIWNCGGLVGAGRGSSCSGLNHYLLGVTQLDPIKEGLPFWRYLNTERIELGDIDIDLCPSKKGYIVNQIKIERGQNFNEDIDALSRMNLGCVLVATFGTETTKSAIQTACRGYRSEDCPDGIDVDTAKYLSSLVPSERGFLWGLNEVVYGNPEKGRQPSKLFIHEINQYPGLLDIMFGIEGLINKRSSHASGVIFADEDPYDRIGYMKAKNGEVITCYDLHDAEAAGMVKYDLNI